MSKRRTVRAGASRGEAEGGAIAASSDRRWLEQLHEDAREAFQEGQPTLSDPDFDVLEARLAALGSSKARKWPRCSLRNRRVFSDALSDTPLLSALGGVHASLFTCGLLSAASQCHLLHPLPFLLSGIRSLPSSSASSSSSALVLLLGGSVASVALRSLTNLLGGSLVAVRGDCPNCGTELSEFVRNDYPPSSHHTKRDVHCHTCGRHLQLSIQHSSLRAVAGRFYMR